MHMTGAKVKAVAIGPEHLKERVASGHAIEILHGQAQRHGRVMNKHKDFAPGRGQCVLQPRAAICAKRAAICARLLSIQAKQIRRVE